MFENQNNENKQKGAEVGPFLNNIDRKKIVHLPPAVHRARVPRHRHDLLLRPDHLRGVQGLPAARADDQRNGQSDEVTGEHNPRPGADLMKIFWSILAMLSRNKAH